MDEPDTLLTAFDDLLRSLVNQLQPLWARFIVSQVYQRMVVDLSKPARPQRPGSLCACADGPTPWPVVPSPFSLSSLCNRAEGTMLSDRPVRQTAIWAVVSYFIITDTGGTLAASRSGQELLNQLQDRVFDYIRSQNVHNDPELEPQNVGAVQHFPPPYKQSPPYCLLAARLLTRAPSHRCPRPPARPLLDPLSLRFPARPPAQS